MLQQEHVFNHTCATCSDLLYILSTMTANTFVFSMFKKLLRLSYWIKTWYYGKNIDNKYDLYSWLIK